MKIDGTEVDHVAVSVDILLLSFTPTKLKPTVTNKLTSCESIFVFLPLTTQPQVYKTPGLCSAAPVSRAAGGAVCLLLTANIHQNGSVGHFKGAAFTSVCGGSASAHVIHV